MRASYVIDMSLSITRYLAMRRVISWDSYWRAALKRLKTSSLTLSVNSLVIY